ncbi:MAG: hypothetical protein EOQ48_21785 [Mesorhizobium sp.]|nr:hypothetical protein EN759_27480 [Mesorhizobium sp. M00.F.Ca.ET.038.03.1.1]RWB58744.1 MAG: hypothetical protein EOQ48_21785 [Mesorhizobium sp.]TIV56008.1 MAG: hypothetical protein E5V86_27100 [Mesorhizobium sp.]
MTMDYKKAGKFALQFMAAAAIGTALAPASAYAQSAAPVEGVLEWFVGVLQGSIARSFGIIAVCFLGFLAMTGRLVWMMALSIIIGIALVFGAAALVDSIRSTAGGA